MFEAQACHLLLHHILLLYYAMFR